MPIKTNGINHPALFGRNLDETIQFYTEVLGMRLVLRQPNLDEPRMTHLFFSAGNGAFIAFFVPNEDSGLKLRKGSEGVGSMQHLAMNLVGRRRSRRHRKGSEHPRKGRCIQYRGRTRAQGYGRNWLTTSGLEFSGYLHKSRYLYNL
jgi:catechol 2,3-dioxygenase-like lactoylglutathione lyase family enzyme